MSTLDHWDRRFLSLADFIAKWSKDPSTQVGAVVTHSKSRRIVSTGFNGFPAGVEDAPERLFDRATKYEMIVHAEQNALMFAGQHAEGCTLYVTPLPPCALCAALIIQAGIVRVVSSPPDFAHERWGETARIAKVMFQEAKVAWDWEGG